MYINIQAHYLTISDDLQVIYSFDREGRMITGFVGGVNYWRGLSGTVLMKQVLGSGEKVRRWLSPEASQAVVLQAQAYINAIGPRLPADSPPDLMAWITTILAWDAERIMAEQARFQTIYKPISILPPDHYRAVVFQATEGCSWNRCNFCTFYRDRMFRIKSPEAFRAHVQQVKQFLGRGLGLRKSVFLGDANALIIPQQRLLELLHILHEELPINATSDLKGIYAFLDIFGAEQKSAEQYAELLSYGVKRIYIGLESGDETVFQLLHKPGSPQACIEAVHTIKAAGINVGIILLAGAGGVQLAEQHQTHSIHALSQMNLGIGDLVYISPLIAADEGEYLQQSQAQGIDPLTPTALQLQLATLKAEAKRVTHNRPKVALYHIEEFIY